MAIKLPTLAERVDDIPDLVEYFVRRARPEGNIAIARAAIHILQEREWPGNVRELKQVVEAALVFSGCVLDAEALAVVLAQRTRSSNGQSHNPAFIDRQRLMRLLTSADWDTELAATRLGVHRTTIYRRMRRLGIPVPSSNHQPMSLADRGTEPFSDSSGDTPEISRRAASDEYSVLVD